MLITGVCYLWHMIFEKIPTVPTAEELLDKAFRRAVRTRRGKTVRDARSKLQAEEAMLLTASNILSDNLFNIVQRFPSFDNIPPFYRELADVLAGIDKIKPALSSVQWAGKKIGEVSRSYIPKMRSDGDAVTVRKAALGRISSIVYELEDDLLLLNEARNKLRTLPDVRDEPTIVVAGYPNVGKSSFVALVSSAKPEIAPYPFTTKGLAVGHFTLGRRRYQVMDTPGLLDRPLSERNSIELQAISALKHVGTVVLFILDPSETCGYSLEEQRRLLGELRQEFGKLPMLVVSNKKDMLGTESAGEVDAVKGVDMSMSTLGDGDGVREVLERLVGMIGTPEPDGPGRFANR